MYDRTTILHLVNDAERQTPRCACGDRMIPVDRDGSLWLECASRRTFDDDLLGRLRAVAWSLGHDRRLILHADELQAA